MNRAIPRTAAKLRIDAPVFKLILIRQMILSVHRVMMTGKIFVHCSDCLIIVDMKNTLRFSSLLLIAAFALFSCTQPPKVEPSGNAEIDSLQNAIAQRDSMISGIGRAFQKIDSNLAIMRELEDDVMSELNKGGGRSLNSIRGTVDSLRYLMSLNSAEINALDDSFNSDTQIGEVLSQIISTMRDKILISNLRTAELQKDLETLGKDFANLFDEYIMAEFQRMTLEENIVIIEESASKVQDSLRGNMETMEAEMEALRDDQFKGFVVAGNTQDLIDKGILQDGGDMSNAVDIDRVDRRYFREANIIDMNVLVFASKKISLASNHPEGSYSITTEGGRSSLKISDKNAFWKDTRYVVVVTD